ncbi:unnamed protein product [Enterobius vermicularis]|uniref:Uncharacterized protein n=1 Tax=Enterobius vermicularis TaxID=51028 RepID=A0A0N4V4D5_ENTVE|nr:unnamed protein product [Enterobius vermicularis]
MYCDMFQVSVAGRCRTLDSFRIVPLYALEMELLDDFPVVTFRFILLAVNELVVLTANGIINAYSGLLRCSSLKHPAGKCEA